MRLISGIKFFKKKTWFCRWKSTDNNDINILLSLGNPCTFLIAKEKKEKTSKDFSGTNRELSQNDTEKQIMPSKIAMNELFNDIWCYSFIACLIEKLANSSKSLVYP